jgi:hypothetical protein
MGQPLVRTHHTRWASAGGLRFDKRPRRTQFHVGPRPVEIEAGEPILLPRILEFVADERCSETSADRRACGSALGRRPHARTHSSTDRLHRQPRKNRKQNQRRWPRRGRACHRRTACNRRSSCATVRVPYIIAPLALREKAAVVLRGRDTVHTNGSAWTRFHCPTGVRNLPMRNVAAVLAK